MSGINLEQLRTFVSVATLGSFTAAAARANMTQPAASLQIKQLEQRLGVRLIERVGRRAQPTMAGRELLMHAERIEREIGDAIEAMAPHRSGATGRVRIGTGATACIHLLPAVIAAARAKMPGLEVTVHIGDAQEVLHDLEANRYDLGVVTLPASGRSFEVETICDDALLAVTTNGAMASAAVIDPAFLAEKNLLLYEGGNTREIVDRWFATAGIQPKPVMEFGSVEAIKELVRAGLGWSILPAMAVKSEGLDTRPLTPGLQRSLGMVVRRDKHLSRGLREIMQSLRNL